MKETASQDEITQLLLAWRAGDPGALDALMPIVYAELRKLARGYMRNQRADHTLQTTALVNEAYLRLIDSSRVNWQNRTHFFAISAQLMRRVLVDFAHQRGSRKRGGDVRRVHQVYMTTVLTVQTLMGIPADSATIVLVDSLRLAPGETERMLRELASVSSLVLARGATTTVSAALASSAVSVAAL